MSAAETLGSTKSMILKSAVIGYGYWGANISRVISQNEHFSLDLICDLNQHSLNKALRPHPHCRVVGDFRKIADEIEVIAIATPTSSHYELAKYFLEKKKHVLVAKPLSKTLHEAEYLYQLAKSVGRVLFVDHTFVFHPAVRILKTMLPKIGCPFFVLSQRLNLGLYQPDVNVIYDLMPHDLSIVAYLFETEISPTHAYATAAAGLPQEDLAHCSFVSPRGLEGLITVSWLSPSKIRQFIIVGSNGVLLYDDVAVTEKIKYYDRGIDIKDLTNETSLRAYTSRISYRTGDLYSPAIPNSEALEFEIVEFYNAISNAAVRHSYNELNMKTMVSLDRILKMTAVKST
jgi:predicted dehydrogenase